MKFNSSIFFRFRKALLYFRTPKIADDFFIQLLFKIKLRSGKPPYFVIFGALDNIRPVFELRAKKVAASKYNIPHLLTPKRADSFAIRTLIKNAKARKEGDLVENLAREIIDAYSFKGQAYKEKVSLNEEVLRSRPFIKYLRKK